MMKFPLSLRENGEANSYAILDGNGKWLLSLLHNGEPLVAEQRENLNYLIACANACHGLKADGLERAAPEPDTVAVDAGALEALRSAMSKLRAPMSRTEYGAARACIIEAASRLLAGGE